MRRINTANQVWLGLQALLLIGILILMFFVVKDKIKRNHKLTESPSSIEVSYLLEEAQDDFAT